MDCKIYRYIFCGCFVTGHVCVNSNDTSPYVGISMKKNVPWHILAPSAVACDMFLLRASAHHWHVSAFLCNREFQGISYYTKRLPSKVSLSGQQPFLFFKISFSAQFRKSYSTALRSSLHIRPRYQRRMPHPSE